jgi:ribosomal-protein-alanine N-acetyltransferase
MSAVISPSPFELRRMAETDLTQVMAIEHTIYEFPWSKGIFLDCLRVGYFCMVCEGPAGVVGYGIMSVGAGECHLLNISIHSDYRRQGLARSLVSYLLDEARRFHARIAFLEVRKSNAAAQRLYASLGFNEIATRPDYYPARRGREDALILAMMLQSSGA